MSERVKAAQASISLVANSVGAKLSVSALFVSSSFNAMLADDAAKHIDRYLRDITDAPATVYDKAMDAWRLKSGEFGGDHRIFDGGHDIFGAWSSAVNALPDDTIKEEISGLFAAYTKDLVTPMGMPIATLSRDTYEVATDLASKIGIEPDWIKDLVTFTGTEGAGACAAIIGAALNWRKKDIENFAEHAAAIGVGSALAANPLVLTISIILIARSYHVAREQGIRKKVFRQFGWGAGKSAAFIATAGLIGGGAWVGVVVGLAATVAVSRLKARTQSQKRAYEASEVTKTIKTLISRDMTLLIEHKL